MTKVMSDENRDNSKLAQEEKISFGEKLRATRESMGLSVQDSASRLHLSPRFITMLETEDLLHSTLPVIYLRGYLRSYTRLLNIAENELNPLLEKLDPTPPTTLTPLSAGTADSLSLSFPLESNSYFTRLASFFIALTILISATSWWYLRANTATPTLAAVTTPATIVTQEQTEAQATDLAYNNENQLNLGNNAAFENKVIENSNDQNKITAASMNLSGKPPLSLAGAAQTQALATTTIPEHTAKSNISKPENDDDSVEETE